MRFDLTIYLFYTVLTVTIRDMYMRLGQGFLLVFSITSASSLRELVELRDQIVRTKGDPNFPMVLVGNKSDLEEDRVISRAKAFQLSQSWGNIPYYETSARKATNINEVFIDVCRQIIRKDIARARPEQSGRRRRRKTRREDEYRDHRDRDRGGGAGLRCAIL
jgi:GTPase SAR1 family protein